MIEPMAAFLKKNIVCYLEMVKKLVSVLVSLPSRKKTNSTTLCNSRLHGCWHPLFAVFTGKKVSKLTRN